MGIFRQFKFNGKDDIRKKRDESALELFETGLKDVQKAANFFVPTLVAESERIRIKVKV